MSINKRLKCYPILSTEHDVLSAQYQRYFESNGNPWHCIGKQVSVGLQSVLQDYYKKPFTEIKYIGQIRDTISPDVCPFCGSMKTGTVDHYLPQADYPEWSIYSKNLVPACDCNAKRQNDVKGNKPYERVLHPYFDHCLSERLIVCEFSGKFDMPIIDLVPLPVLSVHRGTLNFHINTVIKRSTAISWMEKKWQVLRRKPSNFLSNLPKQPLVTIDELDGYLIDYCACKDSEMGTMNNWYSMLIYGIYIDPLAKKWLLNQHNGIISGAINPL
ncbi:hypothetical protein BMY_0596 [Wohlfahrtiimonas chitiniclastica]|nr:hypothetical protein BMY_0596 [Wohlfahrtiimonas chitiniclastica]